MSRIHPWPPEGARFGRELAALRERQRKLARDHEYKKALEEPIEEEGRQSNA